MEITSCDSGSYAFNHDVDAEVVPRQRASAAVHAAAWAETFDELLWRRAEHMGERFAVAVGVDREGSAEELRAHGADLILGDLAELVDPSARWVEPDRGKAATASATTPMPARACRTRVEPT